MHPLNRQLSLTSLLAFSLFFAATTGIADEQQKTNTKPKATQHLVPIPDEISTPCSKCEKQGDKGSDPKCTKNDGTQYNPPCQQSDPLGKCGVECPSGVVCTAQCPSQNTTCKSCTDPSAPMGAKVCPQCDHDTDPNKSKWECFPCDLKKANGDPGQDGVKESCYQCTAPNSTIKSTCQFPCDLKKANGDPGQDGVPDSCYQHDADGNMLKDSCCADFWIEMAPNDNFTGRSLSKLGVGETGSFIVKSNTLPQGFDGIDDTQVEITWAVSGIEISGVGSAVSFEAGGVAKTFSVTATINGCSSSYNGEIVVPDGIVHLKDTNKAVSHCKNMASVGIRLCMYLTPQDVSFRKLKIREKPSKAENITGYFQALIDAGENQASDFDHTPTTVYLSVFGNSGNTIPQEYLDTVGQARNVLIGYDHAMLAAGSSTTPYTNGSYRWTIPFQYKVGSSATVYESSFTTVQLMSVTVHGRACVTKGGVGPHCKDFTNDTVVEFTFPGWPCMEPPQSN